VCEPALAPPRKSEENNEKSHLRRTLVTGGASNLLTAIALSDAPAQTRSANREAGGLPTQSTK
jgi:hypothetical protein